MKILVSEGVENGQILPFNENRIKALFDYDTCVFSPGGYIIVDFGEEICGTLHVLFGGNEDEAFLRIRLGESVYETCAEPGEKNAGNDHSLRDNVYRAILFGDVSTSQSGFRFARIDYVKGSVPVRIARIYAEEHSNGRKKKGYFTCSDERMNEIYSIAERTIAQCVREDTIWDGIKRDRILWIGDLYPELCAAFHVYGLIPQFEIALREATANHEKWVNNIPSYSAWWIICLAQYYELSGKKSFVKEMLPYVDFVVKSFSVIVKENGAVDFSDNKLAYWQDNEFFTDWPTNLTEDSKYAWRYIVSIAMEKACSLYALFGADISLAEDCLARLRKSTCPDSSFKQVTAFGVLSGAIDEEKGKRLLETDTLKGMTCFMSFAIIEAMEKTSDGEMILNLIKEYYGAMLDMGATTFWEDFDMSWLEESPNPITALPDKNRKNIHADFGKFCYKGLRFSLCHGWSTGFISFFYRYVLGIVPTAAGYASVKVEPHLCGLTYAEGAIPTKYGTIRIKHTLENGKIETMLDLPKKIKLIKSVQEI